MWHCLSLMNFINLTNECLYQLFVINNMTICKPIVKFVVSLTSLIKKCTTFRKYMYNFIKIWAFTMENGAFLPKKIFVFFGGVLGLALGPALMTCHIDFLLCKQLFDGVVTFKIKKILPYFMLRFLSFFFGTWDYHFLVGLEFLFFSHHLIDNVVWTTRVLRI